LQPTEPDHYAALGLDTRCTNAQIRAAYRLLARQHHPDVNPDSPDAITRTQAINIAYEILSDPKRRSVYDHSRRQKKNSVRASKARSIISQDVHLRIEEFLRGTSLEVRVNDPANPGGPEIYPLTIPAATAPGTRLRLERNDSPDGGFVSVRLRVAPNFRFKVRGSDLRCDLRIHFRRASEGGEEMISGANGARLRVKIPKGVARGQIIRISGEGLPKPRGGRGDLLVRIVYQPQVRVTRAAR
jgi:curved DNA-binding protein